MFMVLLGVSMVIMGIAYIIKGVKGDLNRNIGYICSLYSFRK